jgi:hypothetical protein
MGPPCARLVDADVRKMSVTIEIIAPNRRELECVLGLRGELPPDMTSPYLLSMLVRVGGCVTKVIDRSRNQTYRDLTSSNAMLMPDVGAIVARSQQNDAVDPDGCDGHEDHEACFVIFVPSNFSSHTEPRIDVGASW